MAAADCVRDCTPSGVTTEASHDGGVLTVGVGAGEIPISSGGSGSENLFAGCTFRVDLTGLEVAELAGGRGLGLDFAEAELHDETARFIWGICPRPIFAGAFSLLWEVGDPPPDVIIEALVDAAIAATDVPFAVPQSSPDGDGVPMLVHLPTWVWVDDAIWQPVSATAAIPEFGISATITATPFETEWDPGNGDDPIVCAQGTPWTAGADDDASDCSFTYTTSTHDTGPFVLTVTTRFDTALTCAPAGICAGADPLGVIETVVGREVTVTQVRGVLTR